MISTKTSSGEKLARPRKLDVACGNKRFDANCGGTHIGLQCEPGAKPPTGWKGIDISPDSDADIIHDLFQFPWPIAANSVAELSCSHFVEHIPHWGLVKNGKETRPGDPDGFFLFFDEVYRIMKKGGILNILHPYVKSDRAWWDPTHVRGIHEATWYYLDPEWRELQALDHYPTEANFEVLNIQGMGLSDEHMSRSVDRQQTERNHYWNVVQDLLITLRVRK